MITAAADQRTLFVFMDSTLPDIPRYRPFHKGIFTTTPSLIPLGTDFGNGVLDAIPLQLDRGSAALIANKHQIQTYRPLILMSDLSEPVAHAAIELLSYERDIAQTTVGDVYPGMTQLHDVWRETTNSLESRFNALALAIGEDIAIVEIDSEGNDRNALMSIAAPSRWAPEEKVGRSFIAPPKVPADRVAILRAAFTKMTQDPAFLADAQKAKLDLNVLTGEQMQRAIAEVTGLSGELLEKAVAINQATAVKEAE